MVYALNVMLQEKVYAESGGHGRTLVAAVGLCWHQCRELEFLMDVDAQAETACRQLEWPPVHAIFWRIEVFMS
jgi:hypothetical protein